MTKADQGTPSGSDRQECPWVPNEAERWLDHCEAWAKQVLREHGCPDDLGPWHRTQEGEWCKPRHAGLEAFLESPEHFATLESFLEPMSAPWLAAWMLWHLEGARDALATGGPVAVSAFLNGARLAMWADHLDLELTGHRAEAEVGDAIRRSGGRSNPERQRLVDTWYARYLELARGNPKPEFNKLARQIADEVGEKFHTVRSGISRRKKKFRALPG